LLPGLRVFRPADDQETLLAWQLALEHRNGPSVLMLSRQPLPPLYEWTESADPRLRVVHVSDRDAVEGWDVDLLATGSEVEPAIAAAVLLERDDGLRCRVRSVLERSALEGRPREAPLTVAVEAGVTGGWYRFADLCIGIERFGLCGHGPDVLRELGMAATSIAERIRAARMCTAAWDQRAD
jgi:transketolase